MRVLWRADVWQKELADWLSAGQQQVGRATAPSRIGGADGVSTLRARCPTAAR